jgi:hypothetical protein
MNKSRTQFPLRAAFVTLVCAVLIVGFSIWSHYHKSSQSTAGQTGANGEKIARSGVVQGTPFAPHTNIPSEASPEMKEFLQNRIVLEGKMAQLRQGSSHGLSPEALAKFRQENANLLTRQSQLAQIIAREQIQRPLIMPPPLQIPPNASPQLQAYLRAEDGLTRDRIMFLNQHRNDDLTTRQAAMQKWRQQNESRYQQLEQMAQALAQNTTTIHQ